MHGRVKSVEREKEQRKTDEERQEDLRKVRMYHDVAGKILALKQQKQREASVLPLTSHLLLLNPEFHMVWSYRREIIDAISASAQDPQTELQELAKTELKLTLDALQRNPKSYSAWFQRQWVIDRGLGDLQKEIGLCNKLLELDERNFHCWNYRRHVCKLAGVSQEDELAFSTLKIEQNFSNYSALHHRTISLGEPLSADVVFEEIALVQQAVFTEPDDQSAWFYYRWLLTSMLELVDSSPEDAVSFLRSQVQWMDELVEMEADAKWVIVTLADLHSRLGEIEENASRAEEKQKSVEFFQRAIAIDQDHANYYKEMIAKVGIPPIHTGTYRINLSLSPHPHHDCSTLDRRHTRLLISASKKEEKEEEEEEEREEKRAHTSSILSLSQMADTSLFNGHSADADAAAAAVAVPSPPSSSVSPISVSDDDALFLHATRKYLQDKLIENAKLSFLQLSQLENATSRFTHLDAVLRDFYTAGFYDIQVLLSFLEALPNWQWTLDGCVILHRVDEVLRTPSNQNAVHMPTLPLAFFLHKLISHLEGSVKVRAESYWYEWVSPTIRAIVMGQEIIMESVQRKELVYAPNDDYVFDGDRRNVFSWRSEWTPDEDKEKWRLIPANAQKDRFYIQNAAYHEYLYAADYAKFRRDDQGNGRSRVFLWRKRNEAPGESGHWQLITLDHENRDVFALYNPYQKEFLYAPSDVYDGGRRHVLTTRHRPKELVWLEERKWRLCPASFSAIEQGIEAFFVKKYPEAVEKLTQALTELPDHTEHVKCFAYRMTANLRMCHFDKIQEDFSAIEALGGDKAAIFHGLAHLWEENAAFLEHQSEHKHTSPFFMQHQTARGDFFFVRKQFDVAVGFYHEVATSQPSVSADGTEEEDNETKRRRANAYLCCGKCFYSLNEAENACQYLSIALEMQGLPLDMEALLLLWMGKCKRKQKLHEEALQLFEKAFDRASAAANASSLPSVKALKQTILMDMKVVGILKQELYTALLSKVDDSAANGHSSNGNANSGEKTLQQMMDLFHCPLSLELMQDPVMTPNGNTYEREMIERHLEVNGNFDPLTRAPLLKQQLYPNRALKMLMETMLSDHRLGLLLASCTT